MEMNIRMLAICQTFLDSFRVRCLPETEVKKGEVEEMKPTKFGDDQIMSASFLIMFKKFDWSDTLGEPRPQTEN